MSKSYIEVANHESEKMNKIYDLIPKTLKRQLQLTLFIVGFFPYLFILIYIHNLGEEKILSDTLAMRHIELHRVKEHIEDQLLHISREAEFLASLDMMNDIIIGDIDRRITQLLIQKKRDLNMEIEILAIDSEQKIVATTAEKKSDFNYHEIIKQSNRLNQNYLFVDDNILFFSPVISTIDDKEKLGYIVIRYSLDNLNDYIVSDRGVRSIIYNPHTKLRVGDNEAKDNYLIDKNSGNYMTPKYLILYEKLDGLLSPWYLLYRIEKSVALEFLDKFIIFVWGLSILGFVVMLLMSLWISRRILHPISQLSKATQTIIETQDYTTQVDIDSLGEIKELSENFNAMIQETNRSFMILEEENRVRLVRFTQLVDIFNQIIDTNSEESCIATAVNKLKILMPQHRFDFSFEFPNKRETMMIYVKNFDMQSCDFYGVISIDSGDDIDENQDKFYHSISTMVMLQLDQIRLIDKTKEISDAKSKFISYMSHELRTPLHTILSSTQYLVGYSGLTLAQQEKIVTIESSANHLLIMINDILDIAQIEAGKRVASPTMASISEIEDIVAEVIDMLGLLAEDTDISFTNHIRDMESYFMVDKKLLKQIVINLLSNSIKFTDNGTIDIAIERSGEKLLITIKDSGIGISEENISQLFNSFTQIKSKNSRVHKGSGLGLVISQKLAHLFGSDIKLISDGEGHGTKATIEIANK